MKILIGYNGSDGAMAAVEDVSLAGLPTGSEILVMTVVEPLQSPNTIGAAIVLAETASSQILKRHPRLRVIKEVATGSPANEILARAASFEPDIIVVGEPQHPKLMRNPFLGLTSHKIVTEAPYTVRIARPAMRTVPGSDRLLVGFDGSAGSVEAVKMILSRTWPADTEIHLLAVADPAELGAVDRRMGQTDVAVDSATYAEWAVGLAAPSLKALADLGVQARLEIGFGQPKFELIRYADAWRADMIFVGPHCAPNSFERFMIGSVSAAVAAHASCSVEIVRGVSQLVV